MIGNSEQLAHLIFSGLYRRYFDFDWKRIYFKSLVFNHILFFRVAVAFTRRSVEAKIASFSVQDDSTWRGTWWRIDRIGSPRTMRFQDVGTSVAAACPQMSILG